MGEVRDTQVENVMLLFQEDTVPQRLINLGANTDWFIDDVPFTNVPQFDCNDSSSPTPVDDVQVMTLTGFVAGDKFQIDAEGGIQQVRLLVTLLRTSRLLLLQISSAIFKKCRWVRQVWLLRVLVPLNTQLQ